MRSSWTGACLGILLSLVACAEAPSPVAQQGPCPTLRPPAGPPAYFEFQVAVPAHVATGFPRYQEAAFAGEVLFQVVVDPCGFPDVSTFKLLKAARPELADRTRFLAATLRFVPAELADGQRVPQLVQQVVEFR